MPSTKPSFYHSPRRLSAIPKETSRFVNLGGANGRRTSKYHGVDRIKENGFVAYVYDKLSDQPRIVYLGRFDKEDDAAIAHDMASLKICRRSAQLNFPMTDYTKVLRMIANMSEEDVIAAIRRSSSSFARSKSRFGGVVRNSVTRKWQARKGLGKDRFLGSYDTEEEAAVAFDIACTQQKGHRAITNYDLGSSDVDGIFLNSDNFFHSEIMEAKAPRPLTIQKPTSFVPPADHVQVWTTGVKAPRPLTIQEPTSFVPPTDHVQVWTPETTGAKAPRPLTIREPTSFVPPTDHVQDWTAETTGAKATRPLTIPKPVGFVPPTDHVQVWTPETTRAKAPRPLTIQKPTSFVPPTDHTQIWTPETTGAKAPRPLTIREPTRFVPPTDHVQVWTPETTGAKAARPLTIQEPTIFIRPTDHVQVWTPETTGNEQHSTNKAPSGSRFRHGAFSPFQSCQGTPLSDERQGFRHANSSAFQSYKKKGNGGNESMINVDHVHLQTSNSAPWALPPYRISFAREEWLRGLGPGFKHAISSSFKSYKQSYEENGKANMNSSWPLNY